MTKIVVPDDIELDSPEEALFYGLCWYWEIPVQTETGESVTWIEGYGWYGPVFRVEVADRQHVFVEVSDGQQEGVLRPCREAWRREFGASRLAVLYREELSVLMTRANHHAARRQLQVWAR